MNYKFLFVVTSAIIPFTSGSANTKEERFQQTLETISSIRKKVPNSIILLTENSYHKLPEEYKDILSKNVDILIENYDDIILRRIYGNLEKSPDKMDFGKSLLETRGLILAFEKIINEELFQKVHRIFKISGRYYLNENFDIDDYSSKCLYNYYVFNLCKFNDNQLEYFRDMMGIDGQVTTGLWSFCSSLMVDTYHLYQKAFSYIDWILSINNSIDIERCLYKFLDMSKVIKIRQLGVNQIHGPTGKVYSL